MYCNKSITSKRKKLHVEWIECLKREYNKSKYFDQIKNDYMPHKLKCYIPSNRIVQSEEEFNKIFRQNAEIENINFHIESKIVFFGANKAANSSGPTSNLNDKQDEESKEENIKVILAHHHGMGISFILDHLTPRDTKSAADFFAQTIWRQKVFLNENKP